MQKELEALQRIGWTNTIEYLTSDYLDVCVAKSMRESWEYQSAGCQHRWDGLLMERIGRFGELPELLIVSFSALQSLSLNLLSFV